MQTLQKFTPDLQGCGEQATPITTSSVQYPVSAQSHLLLRNVSEYYTAFNRAHWGPYPLNCFDHCLSGGLAFFCSTSQKMAATKLFSRPNATKK